MPKRETMTRAKKIAASRAAGEPKKPTVRRQGTKKPEVNPAAPVEQPVSEVKLAPKPVEPNQGSQSSDNVVSIKKSMTVPQTWREAFEHRAKFEAYLKDSIKVLDSSERNDKHAWRKRRDAADGVLEELMKRFDRNGFSNPWSRLVMAHLALDLIHHIGPQAMASQDAVCQIEQVYRGQKMPEHLKHRIDGLRKCASSNRKAA